MVMNNKNASKKINNPIRGKKKSLITWSVLHILFIHFVAVGMWECNQIRKSHYTSVAYHAKSAHYDQRQELEKLQRSAQLTFFEQSSSICERLYLFNSSYI